MRFTSMNFIIQLAISHEVKSHVKYYEIKLISYRIEFVFLAMPYSIHVYININSELEK